MSFCVIKNVFLLFTLAMVISTGLKWLVYCQALLQLSYIFHFKFLKWQQLISHRRKDERVGFLCLNYLKKTYFDFDLSGRSDIDGPVPPSILTFNQIEYIITILTKTYTYITRIASKATFFQCSYVFT